MTKSREPQLDPELFASVLAGDTQDFDEEADDAARHARAADGFSSLDEFLHWANETRERSEAELIAHASPAEQELLLEGIDPEALLHDWSVWARKSQLLPDDGWSTAIVVAGRGWGKSRVGSEWIRKKARENPGCRIILLGRTAADVRDVMVLGESGIIACSAPNEKPSYYPSRRALVWPNGSQALLATSMEPSVLRGPQANFSWADEIGTYTHIPDESGLTAWQNLRIATRLGEEPQTITTTTPKRMPAIVELLDEVAIPSKKTIVIKGRTIDNVAALSRNYLEMLFHLYHGTSLWAQEIMGELVEASEGALWSDALLNGARALTGVPPLPFRCVAVDPSVAENPKDECGIVVVGGTGHKELHKRHAYVLEDATVHGSPSVWAKAVVEAAQRWQVQGVIAEGNQGSELVRMAINAIDPDLKVFLVNARQNKQLRAEPVVTAYEGKRVHHVGMLPTLEAQMTSWEPGVTKKSPDRIDALVYGVAAMLIQPPKGLFRVMKPMRASSAGKRTVPGVKKGYQGHKNSPLRRAA